jgi:toxin FitB
MFLLDTNVMSEFRLLHDNRAEKAVTTCASPHDPDTFFMSAIRLTEADIGIRRMVWRDPRQGRVLRDWLNGVVLPRYRSRIMPIDDRVATLAATFHVPNPAPFVGSLIAATAIIHGLTIVTRKVRHFGFPSVTVLNPWKP